MIVGFMRRLDLSYSPMVKEGVIAKGFDEVLTFGLVCVFDHRGDLGNDLERLAGSKKCFVLVEEESHHTVCEGRFCNANLEVDVLHLMVKEGGLADILVYNKVDSTK
jgi:hypothetical protein